MNRRTKVIIIFSIIIGLFIAFNFSFLSGTSPFLGKIFFVLILGILIWSLILIFRESNKKLKSIQLFILIVAIGIGFYKATKDFDSPTDENPRIYYNKDIKLEN